MQLILLSSTGSKEKSLYPYDMKYKSLIKSFWIQYLETTISTIYMFIFSVYLIHFIQTLKPAEHQNYFP